MSALKKVLVLILFSHLFFFYSCKDKSYYTITPAKGVGPFLLGEELKLEYDKDELDIFTVDDNKTIKLIAIFSSKYKTTDSFGVGSQLTEIEKKLGVPVTRVIEVKKGTIASAILGKGLIYNDITFLDNNKDNIVDEVLVHVN